MIPLALLALCLLPANPLVPNEVDRAAPSTAIFKTLNGEPLLLSQFHEFVGFEHRADPSFDGEREALFHETVIRGEAKRRSIEVRKENLESRFMELDAETRKQDPKGRTLDEILVEQEVDRGEFQNRLEAALMLEQIVRAEFKLGSGHVPEEKQNVWLQDRMAKVRIQKDELPKGLLARVDGQDVTLEEYGRRIVNGLTKASSLRRSLEQQYIEANAVRQYAEKRGITLSAGSLDAAIQDREKKLQGKPGMADAKLDEILKETGSSVEDLKASLRFRTRLLLERLVDEVEYKGSDLFLFYRSRQTAFDALYGEQAILSTIFLKAGEKSAVDVGFVTRSFEAAERELKNLRKDIEEGRLEFESCAKARSDHESAEKNGLLGVVGPRTPGIGELCKQAVAAKERGELKIGDLFGPIRLVDGVHLVKVNGFVAKKRFEDLIPEVRLHAMNELLLAIMRDARVN